MRWNSQCTIPWTKSPSGRAQKPWASINRVKNLAIASPR
jgi:hypothetical protein